MPCNSGYMKASNREIELSRVACLLGEINGIGWKSDDWSGYHPSVYCRHLDKATADKMVAALCDHLQNTDVTKYSLEMQIWWRDHQKADAERLKKEMEAIKIKEEKQKAMEKLTDYEKKLLGLI